MHNHDMVESSSWAATEESFSGYGTDDITVSKLSLKPGRGWR